MRTATTSKNIKRVRFTFGRSFIALPLVFALSACWPEEDVATMNDTIPVRGLITTLVADVEEVTVRRYPGVLEPSEVNRRRWIVEPSPSCAETRMRQRRHRHGRS